MALNLTMVLKVDSAAAKAELDAATRGIKGVTVATGQLGTESRSSASEAKALVTALNLMESESKQNTVAIREMTAALAAVGQQSSLPRVRRDTDAFGQSANQAAGATGNLIAQFNDIGMMMAAGQNPLQLAIQQGTQITQVIGPMGAAGAAKALGGALLGMLNPLSLITLGTIAAGAAMVQWLTGASEEAVTLADQIEALTTAVSDWREQSGQSFADLRETFGTITPELVAMQREISQLKIAQVMIEATAAARALSEELQGGFLSGQSSTIADLLGFKVTDRAGLEAFGAAVSEIKSLMDAVGESTDLSSQLAAVQALRQGFAEAVGGVQNMNAEQLAFYQKVLDSEAALRAAAVATGDVTQSIGGAVSEAEALSRTIDAMAGNLGRMAGVSISGVFSGAQGPANALLGTVFALGQEMYRIAAFQKAQMDIAASGKVYSGRGGDPRKANTQGYGEFVYTGPNLDAFNNPVAKGGRGGGGASEAQKEAKALQDLIASLEAEIDALREQDPIQREMLKHRQALAGATEAERQKVEELIATREREAMLMEGAKARAQFFEEIGTNALDALINKGESFNDVLKNIVSSLIQAVIQAAIFGQGPFGSLFGGKSILSGLFGGGGGLGSLLGGGDLFGGLAEGGMVHGAGTGTSDDIPKMLSNGEYVVNAKATARNRALLEAINAGGSLPGFANGGYVGGDSRRMAARGGSDLPATIYIDARGSRGNSEIEDMVRKGAVQVVNLYDREGLAVSVQRVSSDPRRRG